MKLGKAIKVLKARREYLENQIQFDTTVLGKTKETNKATHHKFNEAEALDLAIQALWDKSYQERHGLELVKVDDVVGG